MRVPEGHTDVVTLPLREGAQVNALGGDCMTTFMKNEGKAASRNAERFLEFLIRHQRHYESIREDDPSTALRIEHIVQQLLDSELDVNIRQAGFGPASSAACRGGHSEIFKLLLKHQADVNVEDGAYGYPI